MTPEGIVKKKVKELLLRHNIYPASKAGVFPPTAVGWYYMPSATPMGVKGIPDFMGAYYGLAFGVETKAPGKKPTGFQALQIKTMRSVSIVVFVIDGDMSELEYWLNEVKGLRACQLQK